MPKSTMNNLAPEYTNREKITLIIKYLSIGLPIITFFKYWFFPKMDVFSAAAHCYDFGPLSGVQLLFYGVLVGLPLSIFVVLLVLDGKRCLLIFKHKQAPPPGYKVFKPTKYKYGNKALLQPTVLVIIYGGLLLLSVHGIGSAKEIINSSKSIELVQNKVSLPECKGI
jgi:hypothetical protein